VSLQAGAAVAAGKATRAEARAEDPLRRDRSVVEELQHLVGDDAGERGD
jgi:hypothetical protein